MRAERRLMTIDSLDLFLPVPGPERPKSQVRPVRQRELREPVESSMFANPVACMHVIRVSVFRESSCSGLLRCEESLVLLSELEEALGRFSVRLSHDTVLQVFCSIRKISLSQRTIHPPR